MFRRFGILTALVLTMAATVVAPASAGSSYLSKTDGRNADANWTQDDGGPLGTTNGNFHIGYIDAYGTSQNTADAYGFIEDFDCSPGQEPWGDENGDNACTYVGFREISGSGLSFVMDRKLTSATLTGEATIYSYDDMDYPTAGVASSIDLTWTGTGSTSRTMSTYRYVENGTRYSDRFHSTSRQASLSGSVQNVTINPNTVWASLSTFKEQSSSRTK